MREGAGWYGSCVQQLQHGCCPRGLLFRKRRWLLPSYRTLLMGVLPGTSGSRSQLAWYLWGRAGGRQPVAGFASGLAVNYCAAPSTVQAVLPRQATAVTDVYGPAQTCRHTNNQLATLLTSSTAARSTHHRRRPARCEHLAAGTAAAQPSASLQQTGDLQR